jgi:hypothetical protein
MRPKVCSDWKNRCCLLGPGARLRGLPAILPDGRAQRPVDQVAHVRQNLHGHAAGGGKSGKVIGRAFQSTNGAIGQSGQRMAQQFSFLVHISNYSVRTRPPRRKRRSRPKLVVN